MKRYILLFIFVFCLAVHANSISEDKFINALRNCSSYSENLDYAGTKIKLVCNFSKSQIDEIASVADAYYLTLKYSNEQPDFSSTEALQNNPVVRVLSKYLQDTTVCNLDGLQ